MRNHFPSLLVTLVLTLALPLRAETIAEAALAVESELGGRVGVVVREPGTAPIGRWRSDERFPMSSTFKAPLCGAILARVDKGEERLDRVIAYKAGDVVSYSPVTEKYTDTGMSVGDLCAATITLSDNTAGNLLLATLGGPKGFTTFLCALGDKTSRLDRWEPELNEGVPNDERDTTTPEAMADTLDALLFSDSLSMTSRTRLEAWLREDLVAAALIRASLPNHWTIGDKTGAGGFGSRSIVADKRTPGGSPWLAAIYLTGNKADIDARNRAIARIGAAIVDSITRESQTSTTQAEAPRS